MGPYYARINVFLTNHNDIAISNVWVDYPGLHNKQGQSVTLASALLGMLGGCFPRQALHTKGQLDTRYHEQQRFPSAVTGQLYQYAAYTFMCGFRAMTY